MGIIESKLVISSDGRKLIDSKDTLQLILVDSHNWIFFPCLEKKYMVVHCTGYLKSWAPAKIGMNDQDGEGNVDACNLSCLVSYLGKHVGSVDMYVVLLLLQVAVGRVHPSTISKSSKDGSAGSVSRCGGSNGPTPPAPSIEFTSRHAIDGKFVFVDQR